jgi:hypothetical protein
MKSSVSQYLKRFEPVYAVNASLKAMRDRWQSRAISRQYRSLCKRVAVSYTLSHATAAVRQRLRVRGIHLESQAKGALRLLWVGADPSQDQSGMLTALAKFGRVASFCDERGSYLQEFPTGSIARNSALLVDRVRELKHSQGLDILIGQMWGNTMSAGALRKIQALGVATVNIAMDDRLPWNWRPYRGNWIGARGLCPGLDLTLTSSHECCERYWCHGYPSVYWPFGSDPELFVPAAKREPVVCFIGGNYGVRRSLVRHLTRSGIPLVIYGPGWPNGPVGAVRMAELFGSSLIVLGVGTVGHRRDLCTLKLRDFDATMAGALYITSRNEDLYPLFAENAEIVFYDNFREAAEKIRYYLDRPEEAMAIGNAAAARARREHTWERRLDFAFDLLGVRIPGSDFVVRWRPAETQTLHPY